MKIEIVSATLEHALELAPRLRQADRDEVFAASGVDPKIALLESVAVSDSDMCWAAYIDGSVEVIWGVAQAIRGDNSHGNVWLLSSDKLYRVAHRFVKQSHEHIELMLTRYSMLSNYIDYRNIKSMVWLTSLGFQPIHMEPKLGYEKRPFIQFARFRNV